MKPLRLLQLFSAVNLCAWFKKITRTKLLFLLGYILCFSILGCSESDEPVKRPEPEPEPEPIVYTLEPVAVTYPEDGGVLAYNHTIDSSFYNESDKLVLTKRFYSDNTEKESRRYQYLDNQVIVTEGKTGEEFVSSFTGEFENGSFKTISYDHWKVVSGSDRWAEFFYAGAEVTMEIVDYYTDTQRVLRNKYRFEYSGDDITYIEFTSQNGSIIVDAVNIKYDTTLNPFYKSLQNGFFGADPLEIIQQLSKHNIKSYEHNDYSNHTSKAFSFTYTIDSHSRVKSRSFVLNEAEEKVDIKNISYRND